MSSSLLQDWKGPPHRRLSQSTTLHSNIQLTNHEQGPASWEENPLQRHTRLHAAPKAKGLKFKTTSSNDLSPSYFLPGKIWKAAAVLLAAKWILVILPVGEGLLLTESPFKDSLVSTVKFMESWIHLVMYSARAILVDLSPPLDGNSCQNIQESLLYTLTLLHHLLGPPRLPLVTIIVLSNYPEVLDTQRERERAGGRLFLCCPLPPVTEHKMNGSSSCKSS